MACATPPVTLLVMAPLAAVVLVAHLCQLAAFRSHDSQVPDMIDIVVSEPKDEEDTEGKKLHTTFLITTHTNLPEYKSTTFSVRRRYSDFECALSCLLHTRTRIHTHTHIRVRASLH